MELLASERAGQEGADEDEVQEHGEEGEKHLEGQDGDDEGGEVEDKGAGEEVLEELAEVELGETEQVRNGGF